MYKNLLISVLILIIEEDKLLGQIKRKLPFPEQKKKTKKSMLFLQIKNEDFQ